MKQRRSALVGVSALMSAALLVGSPYSAYGAGHGGGHGGGAGHAVGGFRAGGFHPGGFPGRGFHGPGFYGGFYPGFWGYGYPWWYGGFGLGLGLGYGLGYGYAYPYYPYGLPPYYGPAVCAAAPPAPAPAPAGRPVPVSATDVVFSIRVPDKADVWINGEKTAQYGPTREFLSSGLESGRTYTFDIRARWAAPDGTTVQLERRVSVQGGQRRTVDFLRPAESQHTVVPAASASGP